MFDKFARYYNKVDKVIFYSSASSIFLVIFLLVLFGVTYSSLPKSIPMFYSLPWGQSQLATLSQFVLLPSLMVLTTLLNLIISWHLHSSQLILKRITNLSSLLVSVLLFVTGVRIIFLFI